MGGADGDRGVVPSVAPHLLRSEPLPVARRWDLIDQDLICRKCFPSCRTM
jgi:hypothetical protein